MEKLNHEYKEVMLLQQQCGGHRYPNGLTHKTFPNLVLEECSPWIEEDIGNGMKQKLMRFTAGPVRDIHLSGPTTIVYQYHKQRQDFQKVVELAFHIAYLPGFCCLYHLGSNYLDDLVSALSPSLVKMFQLAQKSFKAFHLATFRVVGGSLWQ